MDDLSRGMAGVAERLWRAENALRNIEEACNYSPNREAGTWDVALASLIHQSARLLPPGVQKAAPMASAAEEPSDFFAWFFQHYPSGTVIKSPAFHAAIIEHALRRYGSPTDGGKPA